MDSNREKRVDAEQENTSDGSDQMDEDKEVEEGLDQEVEKKMTKKGSSFCVKFSVGKPKSKANEASNTASQIRVCDFCGRQFSSGKALGGHRRYHLQILKQQSESHDKVKFNHFLPSNNDLKNKPNSEDQFDDDGDDIELNGKLRSSFSCCICKKDFPSRKSLFGHMRSHPEREWRGMNPPFHEYSSPLIPPPLKRKVEEESEDHSNVNNGSSSSVSEVVVDLSVSCSPSWLKKDRRGRTCIGAAEAADTLIFLASHENHFLPPPRRQDEIAIPVKKRKKKSIDASEEDDMKADNVSEVDDEIWKLKEMARKKGKKKKMHKIKKLQERSQELDEKEDILIRNLKDETLSSPSPCYECSICHKSFPTFQALGGHRSRHNRDKNIARCTKDKKQEGEEEEEEQEAAQKVCTNETVSSTTALEEDGASPIIEDRLSSYDQDNVHQEQEELGEASQSGSKILDFDLNEPFVMEDVDE